MSHVLSARLSPIRPIGSLLLIAMLALFSQPAWSQTTGGVFGPVVNEGHKSLQYRVAFDPDSEKVATRLHYQQALDDDLMWRVVLQTRDTAEDSLDFNFLQGELFWQLSPNGDDWQYGLRFDLRYRDDGRSNQAGVNFMNHVNLSPKWSVRGILLTAKEFGDNAADGIKLGTRARVSYKSSKKVSVGADMFSNYGSTEDFYSGSEQRHQLGPFVSVKLPNSWSIYGAALFGLTESTADTNYRVFVVRKF
jgi:hypothetical protein